MRYLFVLVMTMMTAFAHAELTPEKIQQWLPTMKPVQEWMEANESKVDTHSLFKSSSKGLSGMFDEAIAELKNAGLYDDFAGLLKKHGYASVEGWAADTQGVTTAFMAIKMEGEQINPAMIQAQIVQVKDSPLPDEQKRVMLGMLEGTLAMMKEVSAVPEGDKAVVRPHMKAIEQSFGHGH